MSPGNAGFFHSDSTPVVAMQLYDTGGTPNPPILVVKGADELEKFAPLAAIGSRIAGSLAARAGKKKLGKVGVTSATAGTAGKSSLDQAMDMATDSGPPAAGFGTKTLENTATSAPKQSMTNLDGGGAAVADKTPTPPSEMPGGGNKLTDFGVDIEKPEMKNLRGRAAEADMSTQPKKPEMTQTTLKPDDPNMKRIEDEAQNKKIGILQDKAKRDRALGAGYVGISAMQNRAQAKDAERQREMERIEAIAADGRAKANTGAKVAVA